MGGSSGVYTKLYSLAKWHIYEMFYGRNYIDAHTKTPTGEGNVNLLSKYEFQESLLYSKDHLWARIAQDQNPQSKVYVGMTDFGQQKIGPIEFIRILPKGRYISRGHPFGSVESGRRIVLLRAPIFGVIQETNEELREHPDLINSDPYGRGWIATFQPFQLEEDRKELVSRREDLERLVATAPR